MNEMLQDPVSLRTRRMFRWSLVLCAITAFGCAVLARPYAFFLPWNLFLAWVPYVIGRGIVRLARRTPHGTGVLVFPTALWLLFFPNAPYILTDLVHVGRLPAWLMLPGAVLILAYAILAMMLGLYSLKDVHGVVRSRLGPSWGWAFAGTVLFLSAIGVWMGRVLRWNSWDVLHDPWGVVRTTLSDLATKPMAWAFVAAFTSILVVAYVVVVRRAQRHEPDELAP